MGLRDLRWDSSKDSRVRPTDSGRRRLKLGFEGLESRSLLSTSGSSGVTSAAAIAPAKSVGTWTIMVYITGDNLNADLARNILQMENLAAKLPSSVKIAVFWSQPTLQKSESGEALYPVFATDDGHQAWTTGGVTEGMGILQGANHVIPSAPVDLPEIRTRFDLGTADGSRPETLLDFLLFAKRYAPARRYALILSDHGGGVDGFNGDDNYTEGSKLYVSGLASALTRARSEGVSLSDLAFDECLMASTEVEYGLKSVVPIVVASEELISGAGYSYEDALSGLETRPKKVSGARLAVGLVQSFSRQVRGETDNNDTLSAVNTSRLRGVIVGLGRIVKDSASIGSTAWQALGRARASAAVYGTSGEHPFRDLGQFLESVATEVPNRRLQADARSALKALNRAVFSKTPDVRGSTGLTVVLPQDPYVIPSRYPAKAAAFNKATGWRRFLVSLDREATTPDSEARDWAEPNNQPTAATSLRTIASGTATPIPLLTLPTGDVDWYKFQFQAPPTAGDTISVAGNDVASSDVRLQLYRMAASDGNASATGGLALVAAASGPTLKLDGLERLSRNTAYFLKVGHAGDGPGFSYTLDFRMLSTPAPILDTFPTANLSMSTPIDLGTVNTTGYATVAEDAVADQNFSRSDASELAWYQFEPPRSDVPLQGEFVVYGMNDKQVVVTLYDSTGRKIKDYQGASRVVVPYSSDGGASRFTFSVGGEAGNYRIFFEEPEAQRPASA